MSRLKVTLATVVLLGLAACAGAPPTDSIPDSGPAAAPATSPQERRASLKVPTTVGCARIRTLMTRPSGFRPLGRLSILATTWSPSMAEPSMEPGTKMSFPPESVITKPSPLRVTDKRPTFRLILSGRAYLCPLTR